MLQVRKLAYSLTKRRFGCPRSGDIYPCNICPGDSCHIFYERMVLHVWHTDKQRQLSTINKNSIFSFIFTLMKSTFYKVVSFWKADFHINVIGVFFPATRAFTSAKLNVLVYPQKSFKTLDFLVHKTASIIHYSSERCNAEEPRLSCTTARKIPIF